MTSSEEYRAIKRVQDYNQAEAKRRIAARFGGTPPNCEDKEGNIICPAYVMCKQVRTYERGIIPEPLCALPDEEVQQFVVSLSRKVCFG